jgi:phosphoglycolate phosphatase-like HAD superfamily hydrolase
MTASADGVILDLDGTLVDSVHQHVVAWRRALLERGHDVAQARIHAGIGMGGDRLVPWLLGGAVDEADEIARDHTRRFLDDAAWLRPTRGARALVSDLETRGIPFIVATSSGGDVREALLAALGRDDLPVADADDVASSKPAPDLLVTAAEQAGFSVAGARMVGDSPWDAIAARRAGATPIAVRSGAFGDRVLREAGAERIVDVPADLVGQL